MIRFFHNFAPHGALVVVERYEHRSGAESTGSYRAKQSGQHTNSRTDGSSANALTTVRGSRKMNRRSRLSSARKPWGPPRAYSKVSRTVSCSPPRSSPVALLGRPYRRWNEAAITEVALIGAAHESQDEDWIAKNRPANSSQYLPTTN